MEKEKDSQRGAGRVVGFAQEREQAAAGIRRMAEVLLLSPEELTERKIIYPGMPQREVLNEFREIRTKLLQRSGQKNFVLMVSSVSESGGGSFAAINLASVFALDERRTSLYIDCNLHHPYAAKLLPTEPEYGLTDYLENPALSVEDIIYASGIPRLRVIPAGTMRETAVEYFNSLRMEELMRSLKQRYPDRFIILDVPAVNVGAEARILAQLCDYAVLVVPFGKVTTGQVLSGVDAVGRDRFAGLVFNNS